MALVETDFRGKIKKRQMAENAGFGATVLGLSLKSQKRETLEGITSPPGKLFPGVSSALGTKAGSFLWDSFLAAPTVPYSTWHDVPLSVERHF